jgi:hypothetical protein
LGSWREIPAAGGGECGVVLHQSRTWKPEQLSQLLRQLLCLFNTTVLWFGGISTRHSIYLIGKSLDDYYYCEIRRSQRPHSVLIPSLHGAESGSESVESVSSLRPHKAAALAGSLPPFLSIGAVIGWVYRHARHNCEMHADAHVKHTNKRVSSMLARC